MPGQINKLMQRLDYKFNDHSLLELALTHRSKSNQHNERLEFLGDAVLDVVISKALYTRFPTSAEGELTTARAKLVCASFLYLIAGEIELAAYLRVGKSQADEGISKSVVSDALEALFGAILLDAGYQVCETVIIKLYAEHLDNFDISVSSKDSKTRLQEFTQKNSYNLPEYTVQDVSGAAHQQTFRVCCSINELSLQAVASSDSKRKAEQAAAEKILQQIQEKQDE